MHKKGNELKLMSYERRKAMVSSIAHSTDKPIWLVNFSLATLVVLVISSPGFAAHPERPQAVQEGSTIGLVDTNSMPGDVNTQNRPDATCPSGGQCFADVPSSSPFYAFVNRIYQQDLVTGYPCGGFGEPCDGHSRPYYRPNNTVTRQQKAKFIDNARHLPGIDIEINAGIPPIISHNKTSTAITAY